ncbi:hypothetical protein SSP24_72120 [Streptomyces spinoverrucosus]|uniref:CN hydrolase domain-containing protein n=1 Tax=Streptomyces spinoverrucosus TaxID=284043 RepID=A0A4Y3VRS7_9ACTN|nr:hypothetical protein SSP24_72120 [Streptomyces spinoverrucosus]GHB95930.1 hypothetical protein GCM10010397_80720 [Streptomyces spinoverrucosus]
MHCSKASPACPPPRTASPRSTTQPAGSPQPGPGCCSRASCTRPARGPARERSPHGPRPPAAHHVARIAAEHHLAIAYGYPERDGSALYNSVQLIGPDGTPLANYRKTHLFGGYEGAVFTPGDTHVVQAAYDGVRIGLLIC